MTNLLFMNKKEVIDFINNSDFFKKWHFLKYHFDFYNNGSEHPLAKSIVEMIIEVENIIPKTGLDYIKKIASINNKPNNIKHYQQILQILAELIIIHKAVTFHWAQKSFFLYEPRAGGSPKNPELTITTDTLSIGLEVKAPEFVTKHNERATKQLQIPSRSYLFTVCDKEKTMLPRDNALKDFLISADKKFEAFKKNNPHFYSVLVVVWDDFIFEPISALSSPQSGLFTENSFALDKQGNVLKFTNLDCVIVTRHLLNIVRGTRNESPTDLLRHPLDYGRHNEIPFKVIIQNPWSNLTTPIEIIDCFQVHKPGPELGAEYLPSDFISWTSNRETYF